MDVFIVLLVLAFMGLFVMMSLPLNGDEGLGPEDSQPIPSDVE